MIDHFETSLKSIKQQFLCCTPLLEFSWHEILLNITWEQQERLILDTIQSNVLINHPIKTSYQISFLKHILHNLEHQNLEIHDTIYTNYGRLIATNDDFHHTYKHYQLNDNTVITLKENPNIISCGTTGLCTWQAAVVLAEWSLANTDFFENKNVLELGSGNGLTGLTIALRCKVNRIYLTDCHDAVLKQLQENVDLNVDKKTDSEVVVEKLNWGDVDAKDRFSGIDIVIAADVVYDISLFRDLIDTMVCILESGGVKIVLACTERNPETVEAFLNLLQEKKCEFKRLELAKQKNFVWCKIVPTKLFLISKSNSV